MDEPDFDVNQFTANFLRKASKFQEIPLYVRAQLSHKAAKLVTKDVSEGNRKNDTCTRCGLKLNVETIGVRTKKKRSRKNPKTLMRVHCRSCQLQLCTIDLKSKSDERKQMEERPSTSHIEFETPPLVKKKQEKATPSNQVKFARPETPLMVLKNASTPGRSANSRKKDKANKLQRLVAIQKAGFQKSSEPKHCLSSFLTSLNL